MPAAPRFPTREEGTDRKVRISTKPELQEFLARSDAGNVMTRHQVLTPDIEVNGDSATGSWYLFGPGTGNSGCTR